MTSRPIFAIILSVQVLLSFGCSRGASNEMSQAKSNEPSVRSSNVDSSCQSTITAQPSPIINSPTQVAPPTSGAIAPAQTASHPTRVAPEPPRAAPEQPPKTISPREFKSGVIQAAGNEKLRMEMTLNLSSTGQLTLFYDFWTINKFFGGTVKGEVVIYDETGIICIINNFGGGVAAQFDPSSPSQRHGIASCSINPNKIPTITDVKFVAYEGSAPSPFKIGGAEFGTGVQIGPATIYGKLYLVP